MHLRPVVLRASLLLAALFTAPAFAAETVLLVDDLNTTPTPVGQIDSFVALDDFVLFVGTTSARGQELWRTDGTAGGTEVVTELIPGTNSSGIAGLTRLGGTMYFIKGLRELWRTDGTSFGTERVVDLGTGTGLPQARGLVAIDDELYFIANDGHGVRQLWSSDGTASGTLQRTSFTLSFRAIEASSRLTPWQGEIYFSATELDFPCLWRTDGTSDAIALQNPEAPHMLPTNPTPTQSLLFFAARDAATGTELWASDGTPQGTRRVADIAPGAQSSDASGLVAAGDRIFFTAYDPEHGRELWTSDGTAAGTVRVADLFPGGEGSAPEPLAFLDGLLYFRADDGVHGFEPWVTDGTEAGTRLLADLFDSSWVEARNPAAPVVLDGELYFSASFGSNLDRRTGIFRMAGAFEEPVLVAETTALDAWKPCAPMVRYRGTFFCGRNLGVTDGTVAGTRPLYALASETSSDPQWFVDLAGTLLFAANDGVHGVELWRSDGTPGGTSLVRDLRPGPSSSNLYNAPAVRLGDRIYFAASDDEHGLELWMSDGTSTGTRIVADLMPGASSSNPVLIGAMGEALYFTAHVDPSRVAILRLDSSGITTIFAYDRIPPDAPRVTAIGLVADRVYFSIENGTLATLWSSDGTPQSAQPLFQLPHASYTATILSNFVDFDGRLAFVADDDLTGSELWISDGTAAGTRLVADLRPGRFGSGPTQLRAVGGLLYFRGYVESHGFTLFRSDGTGAGTFPLGTSLSPDGGMAVVDSRLHFAHGQDLWETDGTVAGTRKVLTVPSPGGASIAELTAVGSRLFFAAGGVDGVEPWVSDGTPAGTRALADLMPGVLDSRPARFTASGALVYFAASHPVLGRELFAVADSSVPACRNGIDDDRDGRVDHPDDPGCWWLDGEREDPACDDGFDNDGDGRADSRGARGLAADPDCVGAGYRVSEETISCGLGVEIAPALGLLLLGLRRCRVAS